MNAIQSYGLFKLQYQFFGLYAFNLSQKKNKTQQNKSTGTTYHQIKKSNTNV